MGIALPLLGVEASQISGHLFTYSGNYEAIASYTVPSGGQSSVVFSGIPQTYQHLQVRGMINTSGATNPTFYYNTDVISNGNYHSHHLWGTGSSVNANDQTANYFNYNPSSSYPSTFVMDIFDYTSTTKNKTTRTLAGSDTNGGTSEIALWSSLWFATPQAINQITLLGAGVNFTQYSSFALYGVK